MFLFRIGFCTGCGIAHKEVVASRKFGTELSSLADFLGRLRSTRLTFHLVIFPLSIDHRRQLSLKIIQLGFEGFQMFGIHSFILVCLRESGQNLMSIHHQAFKLTVGKVAVTKRANSVCFCHDDILSI